MYLLSVKVPTVVRAKVTVIGVSRRVVWSTGTNILQEPAATLKMQAAGSSEKLVPIYTGPHPRRL
jgi:hypothetical protein